MDLLSDMKILKVGKQKERLKKVIKPLFSLKAKIQIEEIYFLASPRQIPSKDIDQQLQPTPHVSASNKHI